MAFLQCSVLPPALFVPGPVKPSQREHFPFPLKCIFPSTLVRWIKRRHSDSEPQVILELSLSGTGHLWKTKTLWNKLSTECQGRCASGRLDSSPSPQPMPSATTLALPHNVRLQKLLWFQIYYLVLTSSLLLSPFADEATA